MSVFVEHEIPVHVQRVWDLTQDPSHHERWDLRFTRIAYLPRKRPDDPQEFEYETRLGFGIRIRGTGATRGSHHDPNGNHTSSLVFRSIQPLSLIRKGSGYWKYTPTAAGTRFVTSYNYTVRWGPIGLLVDRVLFRPLMAWATAWSFDSLAQWATDGTPPEISRRLGVTHAVARFTLALVWLYEAIFPKLIGPSAMELALTVRSGTSVVMANHVIFVLGCIELFLGIALLTAWRRRWPAAVSLIAMVPATLFVVATSPELLTSPFNVIVLNAMVAALSAIVLLLTRRVPSAQNCRWSSHARTLCEKSAVNAPAAALATLKENPYALDL
jgi:hypothetical protein